MNAYSLPIVIHNRIVLFCDRVEVNAKKESNGIANDEYFVFILIFVIKYQIHSKHNDEQCKTHGIA